MCIVVIKCDNKKNSYPTHNAILQITNTPIQNWIHGQVTLSLRQLLLQKAWENVREISESGKSVQLRVTGVNKGGVTGEVEGLKGFIPRSHLIEKNDLDSLIGQLLTATFIQIDQENNKLVLSQREIARANAISQLAVGKLLSGTVVKLQPYGVFVDRTVS